MSSGDQLLLGLKLKAGEDFSSFFPARDLKLVVATLKQLIQEQQDDFIYLSGGQGSGKSHLLHSVCHHAFKANLQSSYIPLSQVITIDPLDVLDGHQKYQFLFVYLLATLYSLPNP